MTRAYGRIKDKADDRDQLFRLPHALLAGTLPPSVDLRALMPPIKDQGQLGCCTGFGITRAVAYDRAKIGLTPLDLSELFVYYNERALEGTTHEDAGAEIRDGFKTLNKEGVCSEKAWPYVPGKFAHKPTAAAYTEGRKHPSVDYSAVFQSEHDLKATLAGGFPVVFGFTVYEAFESDEVARTGVVPMFKPGDTELGGHCVVLCGYDDATQRFLCANSWGASWGQAGYFTLPYAYVLDKTAASDFWVVRTVK